MNKQRHDYEIRHGHPTIFGYPVTLSLDMPDGEVLVVSNAIKIGPEGMVIDPARMSRALGLWERGAG